MSTAIAGPSSTAATEGRLEPWRGDAKPGFVLDSLSGSREDLAAYRGRTVVVHFFATWCEACRKEFMSLRQLSSRLPKEKVAVIGVDVGEVDIRVRRFFENLPVDFPIALDRDSGTAKAWRVDALPMTFVLDRDLSPKFFVDGDLDWDRPEVTSLLMGIGKQSAKSAPRAGGT